jgi:hypothetical protein
MADAVVIITYYLLQTQHLTTRVQYYLLTSGIDPPATTDEFGNYISFTIWQEKKHFNAWRGGEAFKEAHGGTSLFAFVTTMVASAMVLKGAPKLAFYDGLLHQSIVPDSVPETVNGWMSMPTDRIYYLPNALWHAINSSSRPPTSSNSNNAGTSHIMLDCLAKQLTLEGVTQWAEIQSSIVQNKVLVIILGQCDSENFRASTTTRALYYLS